MRFYYDTVLTQLNSLFPVLVEHPKSTSAVKHLYQIATNAFKEVLIKQLSDEHVQSVARWSAHLSFQ